MSFEQVLGKQSQSDCIHLVFPLRSTSSKYHSLFLDMVLEVKSTFTWERVLSE